MPALYLTEQGSSLKKRRESIIIEKEGEFIDEIELHRIDSIFIFGNIQFSTQVLSEILYRKIELVLLSVNGDIKGQVTPPLPKNNFLRLQQYQMHSDESFKLKQSKHLIWIKISNAVFVLKNLDRNNLSKISFEMIKKLDYNKDKALNCADFNELMGIEGISAKIYFSALRYYIKNPEICFEKRIKHPPADEFNSILSLGYTLLSSKIRSLLDAYGFDPYLGLLHSTDYGRPSLALDLLEPYRSPIVDKFALKLFNLKILSKENFIQSSEDGYRLDSEGIKKFFFHWEDNLIKHKVREKMKNQIESLPSVYNKTREYPDHWNCG